MKQLIKVHTAGREDFMFLNFLKNPIITVNYEKDKVIAKAERIIFQSDGVFAEVFIDKKYEREVGESYLCPSYIEHNGGYDVFELSFVPKVLVKKRINSKGKKKYGKN
jgi:hypothetical protein